MLKTVHTISHVEAQMIKEAVTSAACCGRDPVEIAKLLISAYRVIDEAQDLAHQQSTQEA